MKLYFAPLEGITSYTFRNTHAAMFGGCDEYYAPFITPSNDEKTGRKMLRDILPENNRCGKLAVQVLSRDAEAVLKFEKIIAEIGYTEMNINLGCPFQTVVKKGRGAGFLKDTECIERFFDELFEKTELKISVKTRIGFSSADEFDRLIEIYNKYPFTRVIVHPRLREAFYKGEPDMEAFKKAVRTSKNKLCYNGDIVSADGLKKFSEDFPGIDEVMIGRGAIANPALFREINGGERLKTAELIEFTERLSENYLELFGTEIYVLQKMKEIWMYIMKNFPQETKILKAIKKSSKLDDFKKAISLLK